jgi:predicted nuclease of predicted toxin-antitoxin system
MARFYANENFPLPVVEALRQRGHDVLTIQETGLSGQAVSDEAVLAFARAEQRVVLTFNRKHFIRLHLQNSSHAGIVACTFDPDFQALTQRIHDATVEQLSMSTQLVRVNRPL